MHVNRTSISSDTPEIVLESVFNKFDEDHSGQLSANEFDKLLDVLGVSEDDKDVIIQLADSNNDKSIDYKEFKDLVQKIGVEKLLENKNKEFELLKYTYDTFKEYDSDGNGTISWQEFYQHLTKHGFSHQQISAYWHIMDVNQDFNISFEEFWRGFAPQVQHMFLEAKEKQNKENEKQKENMHENKNENQIENDKMNNKAEEIKIDQQDINNLQKNKNEINNKIKEKKI